MKPLRKLGWITLGVALFLSFNLLLNLSPAIVESKSLPSRLERPDPSTAQTTTIPGAASIELAQNPEVASRFQTLAEADELY